jgi:ubiquinone/menaquinone biosynthesis C-methylase UbiE
MSERAANLDLVQSQFRRQADEYARITSQDDKFVDSIVSLADPASADRVLDIACGPGYLTMALARRAAAAVGLDATDKFIFSAANEAARRGIGNLRFVLGDVMRLAFRDSSFGLVACKMAFHHFPEPAEVLAQMVRVATPGGKIVIADLLTFEDPDRADYHNRLERLCDPSHARSLCEAEFEGLFASQELGIAAKKQAVISIPMAAWLAHAAPPAGHVARIRELLEAAVNAHRDGFAVRRDDGQIYMNYTLGTWSLRRAD